MRAAIRFGWARVLAAPDTVKGIGYMLISALSGATVNGIARYLSAELPPFEIAFFRNFFSAVTLSPLLFRYGLRILKVSRPGLMSLRVVLDLVSMLMFFMALSLTPLAQAIAIHFSTPLFVTVLALFFLGEKIRMRRIIGLLIGFAGTWIILRPGLVVIEEGPAWALISAFIWSGAIIVIKMLSRTESSASQTLIMALCSAPLSFLVALPVWITPTLPQFGLLVLLGPLGAIGHWSIAQAMKSADATIVAPIDFTRLLWAAIIGYVVFGEVPEGWTWLGSIMIIASVTYIAYRESRRRTGAGGPPAPTP
ncbi:MAG: DMT family transporter [Rhodospirillales bacterium]|nr:DMT family transporter [Rhodospirillales bacterium]